MSAPAVAQTAPALPADMTTAEKVKDNAERFAKRLSTLVIAAVSTAGVWWMHLTPTEVEAYKAQFPFLVPYAPLIGFLATMGAALVPQNIVTSAQKKVALDGFIAWVLDLKSTGVAATPMPPVPPSVSPVVLASLIATPPMPATATVSANFGPPSVPLAPVDPFDDEPHPPATDTTMLAQFRTVYPKLTEAEAITAQALLKKGTAP